MIKAFPPIRRLIEERDALRAQVAASSGAQSDSVYDSDAATAAGVAQGLHREIIGGMWDEIGRLQSKFLIDHGLRPEHKLLDIGCGSLRGGLHFIPFLNPGNYWGVDINDSLLEAGWSIELKEANLQDRQPREQLVCLKDFEFASLDAKFDFVLAQSVFSHLSFNRIRRCLSRLAPAMAPGGKFFATFFEINPDLDPEDPMPHPRGESETQSHLDPFHYSVEDFEYAIKRLPWSLHCHGDWNHPRDQNMLIFTASK